MKTRIKKVNAALFCLQILTALGYGFRVVTETGTDFGIYYLGGVSTSADFNLSGDFFEHKGPTYYAFIKILSYFIPFGVIGSAITLTFTALVWFACVNKALSIAKIQNLALIALVKLLSISVLFQQTSNSSIFLFGSGLSIIGITYLKDYTLNSSRKSLVLSATLVSFALLTKLDSLAILLPCLLITLLTKSLMVQKFIAFWITLIGVTSLSILVFSRVLPYQLSDALYCTIKFVFTVRWNSEQQSTLDLFFGKNLYTFFPLFTSGILFVIVLILAAKPKSIRITQPLPIFTIYGAIVFLSLGSSKSYHLFDFYTFVFLGLIFQSQLEWSVNFRKALYVLLCYLTVFAMVINLGFAREYRCLLANSECENRFSKLINSAQESFKPEFFMTQGWPYILLKEFPKSNPNVYWPLAVETGRGSQRLAKSISLSKSIMWFDSNDLRFIEEKNPELFKNLFSSMIQVDSSQKGEWVALRNASQNG